MTQVSLQVCVAEIVASTSAHGCVFLECYFQTKLYNPRIARTHHLAEMNRIEQEQGADLVKVGVIQHIAGLNAELNIHKTIVTSLAS